MYVSITFIIRNCTTRCLCIQRNYRNKSKHVQKCSLLMKFAVYSFFFIFANYTAYSIKHQMSLYLYNIYLTICYVICEHLSYGGSKRTGSDQSLDFLSNMSICRKRFSRFLHNLKSIYEYKYI